MQGRNDFTCPVCGSSSLQAFRGRPRARCGKCGAFERSRLLQLVLEGLPLSEVTGELLHLAPEIGVARRLQGLFGDRYRACDLDPTGYRGKGFEVRQLDVCRDLRRMGTGSIGCLVHVHVLEHVRCNVSVVLAHMTRVIRPGGFHVIGLPFSEGYYREDQDPAMSAETRLGLFGHEDHVRLFGTRDFEGMFGPLLKEGFDEIDSRTIVDSGRLQAASIPAAALSGLSGHSIRVFRKHG
jgi:ribosomal protein S27AE